jgi:hypothetical protein
MTAYKPAEHEESTSVAPLLQFFELVHIGDTMQSMVQVYFDRELVCDSFFVFFPLTLPCSWGGTFVGPSYRPDGFFKRRSAREEAV